MSLFILPDLLTYHSAPKPLKKDSDANLKIKS